MFEITALQLFQERVERGATSPESFVPAASARPSNRCSSETRGRAGGCRYESARVHPSKFFKRFDL